MTIRIRWRTALTAAVLAAAMALTACADNKSSNGQQNDGKAQIEAPAPDSGKTDDGDQAELREGSGTYVGQVDPHSIEITVGGTPIVFQLGEGVADALEGLKPNDSVKFKYTEQPVEGDDTLKVLTIAELVRAAGADSGAGADAAQLPDTIELEVELEGMQKMREAKKAVGTGYVVYVFPQFTFDPEQNRMSMNYDPNYYVDIEKLPDGYKPEEVRAEGEAWVKDGTGTVEERTGDEIYEPMRGASLYLWGQKDGLTRIFVVKTIDGADYALKFNQPQGEASEGFLPLAFVSVSSIANTSR